MYLHSNNNVIIQSVPYVNLLGITIDVDINFSNHIALLCSKAGRQINVLSRLSNFLNDDTKLLLLQTFMLSHFIIL